MQEGWLRTLESVQADPTESRYTATATVATAAAQQPKILTNDEIKVALCEILRNPLNRFFEGNYIQKLQEGRKILPFVFIVDEAAYLHHVHYLKAFTWVFDVVVSDLLWTSTGNISSSSCSVRTPKSRILLQTSTFHRKGFSTKSNCYQLSSQVLPWMHR